MRKLIVSSLVSADGINGDPQSWAGDYFDEQAVTESLAVLLASDAMLGSGTTLFRPGKRTNLRLGSVTERGNGVVTLSYAIA